MSIVTPIYKNNWVSNPPLYSLGLSSGGVTQSDILDLTSSYSATLMIQIVNYYSAGGSTPSPMNISITNEQTGAITSYSFDPITYPVGQIAHLTAFSAAGSTTLLVDTPFTLGTNYDQFPFALYSTYYANNFEIVNVSYIHPSNANLLVLSSPTVFDHYSDGFGNDAAVASPILLDPIELQGGARYFINFSCNNGTVANKWWARWFSVIYSGDKST